MQQEALAELPTYLTALLKSVDRAKNSTPAPQKKTDSPLAIKITKYHMGNKGVASGLYNKRVSGPTVIGRTWQRWCG